MRQLGSDGGACLRIAHVGHIAMHARVGMGHELMQGLIELRWRLQHRIAQGKIVDVVSAVLLLELNALFKHAADP